MKSLIALTFFLLSGLYVSAQDTNLKWHTSLEDAKTLSKKSHKPILMYFTGSDWCPPCIALKKDFFESAEFESRAKDFVLVLIDYPRRMDILSEEQLKYNKSIVSKYNKDKSFPKLLVLNQDGSELGRLSGYSSYSTNKDTSYHFAFVDKFSGSNN